MKFILITGIGRGLGASLAKRLLQDENITVVGTTRSAFPRFAHDRLISVSVNTTSDKVDFTELLKALEPIKLNAVIHNAAVLINKPFGDYSEEEVKELFQVNFFNPFLMTQQLIPFMASGSHIVHIGSMGGFQGSMKFPGLSAYSASKGALGILTECLAEELKTLDIRVNCLALGSVNTEMLAEAFPGYKAPLNPDEMADFIYDFVLNGHRFFNGKTLPVSVSVP
ncbi:MAG: SDR family oxidoreductase [Flavobacteriales bacterium]|nr:SDR family oxidoreductase [Flavobacteriales bacterium]